MMILAQIAVVVAVVLLVAMAFSPVLVDA